MGREREREREREKGEKECVCGRSKTDVSEPSARPKANVSFSHFTDLFQLMFHG